VECIPPITTTTTTATPQTQIILRPCLVQGLTDRTRSSFGGGGEGHSPSSASPHNNHDSHLLGLTSPFHASTPPMDLPMSPRLLTPPAPITAAASSCLPPDTTSNSHHTPPNPVEPSSTNTPSPPQATGAAFCSNPHDNPTPFLNTGIAATASGASSPMPANGGKVVACAADQNGVAVAVPRLRLQHMGHSGAGGSGERPL